MADVDLSQLGTFDFTPDWAKGKPDDKTSFKRFEEREERAERPREPRRFEKDGARKPGGFKGEGRREGGFKREGENRREGEFKREGGFRRGDRPAPRPFIKPLEGEVRILPNQKDLGGIIRKVQTGGAAYPLKQLANLFVANPASCVVKVTPKAPAGGEAPKFHVCKACGFATFDEAALKAHVLSAHLGDYYVSEELDCEPPAGAFNCVAKCGLSGELIGPPNLHGYDAKVREMVRTRFPQMSEQAYRARIEMVHDKDTIEAWRQSATKKTVFRKKDEPEAAGIDREAAEGAFLRTIAPALMETRKSAEIPGEMALKSQDLPLMYAVRDAFAKERRFPASLFFALRGAFHHRKCFFFRANDARGMEFVSAAKPTAFDASHAIPELAAIVTFVNDAGLTNVQAIVAALGGDDEAKRKAVLQHIAWLSEKGHLVKYFNGQVAAATDHPKYAPPREASKAAGKKVKDEGEKVKDEGEGEGEKAEVKPVEAAVAEAPAAVETIETTNVKEEEQKNETADQLA